MIRVDVHAAIRAAIPRIRTGVARKDCGIIYFKSNATGLSSSKNLLIIDLCLIIRFYNDFNCDDSFV